MSVDYDANFGLGIQVKIKNDDNRDPEEILEEVLKRTNYKYILSGNCYSWEFEYYIVLKSKEVSTATHDKLIDLKNFVNDCRDLETVGDIGAVGGLFVY